MDLSKPLDKRAYRGTSPTCHDFNQTSASSDGVMLIVGFSAGQVQLIDPVTKELSRLYNEEVLAPVLVTLNEFNLALILVLPSEPF